MWFDLQRQKFSSHFTPTTPLLLSPPHTNLLLIWFLCYKVECRKVEKACAEFVPVQLVCVVGFCHQNVQVSLLCWRLVRTTRLDTLLCERQCKHAVFSLCFAWMMQGLSAVGIWPGDSCQHTRQWRQRQSAAAFSAGAWSDVHKTALLASNTVLQVCLPWCWHSGMYAASPLSSVLSVPLLCRPALMVISK